jgi:hypothetical protein
MPMVADSLTSLRIFSNHRRVTWRGYLSLPAKKSLAERATRQSVGPIPLEHPAPQLAANREQAVPSFRRPSSQCVTVLPIGAVAG